MTTRDEDLDPVDPERFEDETSPAPPAGFEQRLLARLSSAAEARYDAALEAAADALREDSTAKHEPARRRSPLREPVTWLFGLGLAAAAAIATFALISPSSGDGETPYTFVRPDERPTSPTAAVQLDPRGRPAAIDPPDGTGERVLFRAGRVIRIEHLRDGQLDGVAVDFDADGGVIAIRTWSAGEERGPWLELDGHGAITKQGTR